MFPFLRINRREASLAVPVASFPYPLKPCPPIAVFSRHFPGNGSIGLEDARTLAAPMSTIRSIDPRTWSPDYPLVVLSEWDEGLMTETDREYIWQAFGLPVFEYFLSRDGRIVARECEAHEGLHLEQAIDGFAGEVTAESCPCGQPGDRLLSVAAPVRVDAIIEESDPVRMWRNWQTRQT